MYCARCAPAQLFRAERGARIAAHILDNLAVAGIPLVVCFMAAAAGMELDPAFALAMLLILGTLVWQGVLIHRTGQSVGKRVMKIRVVRTDGRAPGVLRIVLLRNGSWFLLSAIPVLGPILSFADKLMLFSESRRCLHDQIADTIVVAEPESWQKAE